VVGIVASRLAERARKPVYLICLEGGLGKGSARSEGGVNLVSALSEASDLLINYGGHDMAAGFSLAGEHIAAFREKIGAYTARQLSDREPLALSVDANVPPSLFTHANVADLQKLEPYGMGHPSPVFALEGVGLEQVTPVGGGRHVKLMLQAQGQIFPGIFFGVDPLALGLCEGDRVDVAFHAEINTFMNKSQVQFQLCDMRLASPARERETESLALYRRFHEGHELDPSERRALRPGRAQTAAAWRYLKRTAGRAPLTDQAAALARKITRDAGLPVAAGTLLVILDVFEEFRLVERHQTGGEVTLQAAADPQKVDLETSAVLRQLKIEN
jgi:single-stranded-DNA-specific exonuclease